MTTQCTASGRPPLSAARLSQDLVRPGGLWRAITVARLTGSTNADLLAQAADGAPEGSVLVAEEQSAGRGRMGRTWSSPPGAALTFSVLLRPAAVPPVLRGWVPLLAGVAVVAAVRGLTSVDAGLKWPNDVLAGGAKLAGILAEQSAGAIVVGTGINVTTQRRELPVDTATSLALQGAAGLGRHELLRATLAEFERRYLAWAGPPTPGDPQASGLREEYRSYCVTLGRRVRVGFPGGGTVSGTAVGIDSAGRLLLRTAGGQRAVSAGDVLHLR